MKRLFAAMALVVVGIVMAGAAHAGDKASADHVICKLTHPWPWGCGHGYTPMADDADGDGVADHHDQCPGTPRGATVDAKGCPSDADGDGVVDGIDTCPGTPAGTMVDAQGCPMDSDRDGVFDGVDQCPGTSEEWAVDDKGCPIPVSETYQEFLDAKSVSVHVQFDSGKSDILAVSEADLHRVGDVLATWPAAKVEIGGHTDSQGSDKFNRTLSEGRAKAVKAWLTSNYPSINGGNLSTKGYGEGQPVASNDTAEGRAQNRRVTFTLMNADELGKDIETRRYKLRTEK